MTPFSLHLKNLLFRLRNGQNIANPLTKSIKLNSPVVFDMAIYITLDIMERYHFYVSEDETAFLAMHIGAEIERQTINRSKIPTVLLCPEYRNLGVDLLNKLLLNFGNQINIVSSVHSEEALQSLDISSFGLLSQLFRCITPMTAIPFRFHRSICRSNTVSFRKPLSTVRTVIRIIS